MTRTVPLALAVFAAMAQTADTPTRNELEQKLARFAPVRLEVDTGRLSAGDRAALGKLMEAAAVVDELFLEQLWNGNRALRERLKLDTTPLGRARLAYFHLNKGPWSSLDEHRAFVPGVPSRKPPGANFYPEDMTKAEFEALPDQDAAAGFFTVVRRDPERKLKLVAYSVEYRAHLETLARLLREAAAATDNAS
ncbi:MAG TPA: hypothetical protein DEH78_30880, partial [Solibacterales bacterium]|nr:hypothetical protein [Bryobacterales bacterium]